MPNIIYELQRQHTAGAYITIESFTNHNDAVEALREIASKTPNNNYHDEDKWQDSTNVHHVNRYRISKRKLV